MLYARLAVDDFKFRIEVGKTMKRLAIFLLGLIVSLSTVAAADTKPALESATKPAAPSASATEAKQKQLMGFSEVPKGHWAYEALKHLADAGISEFDLRHRTKDGVLLMRYEFALVTGRFLLSEAVRKSFKKIDSGPQTTPDVAGLTPSEREQEIVDIIAAFCGEFEAQLEVLGFEPRGETRSPGLSNSKPAER
ncbi:MAG TPA: hypothetical protein VGB77_02145 [Abditibacteriaceae bacterium]